MSKQGRPYHVPCTPAVISFSVRVGVGRGGQDLAAGQVLALGAAVVLGARRQLLEVVPGAVDIGLDVARV